MFWLLLSFSVVKYTGLSTLKTFLCRSVIELQWLNRYSIHVKYCMLYTLSLKNKQTKNPTAAITIWSQYLLSLLPKFWNGNNACLKQLKTSIIPKPKCITSCLYKKCLLSRIIFVTQTVCDIHAQSISLHFKCCLNIYNLCYSASIILISSTSPFQRSINQYKADLQFIKQGISFFRGGGGGAPKIPQYSQLKY